MTRFGAVLLAASVVFSAGCGSLQAAASYTDSHLISSHYAAFLTNVGERLPFVPYFSYSANVRYEHPLGYITDRPGVIRAEGIRLTGGQPPAAATAVAL